MSNTNNVIKDKNRKNKRIITIMLATIAILFAFLGLFITYLILSTNLNKDILTQISTPALVFDSSSNKISDNVQGQPYVKLENLNDYTINAFISIEDKDFYKHKGINVKRIFGAILNNVSSGSLQEGASTITQQLIKNTHLTNDKTFDRKIKEIILSLKLEKAYDKNEILEMYLNAIYFGNGCYGIENASQFYFGKPASDLDINESATLAGIIKSPAFYSPIKHKENIERRKNLILKEMYKGNYINTTDYNSNTIKTVNLNVQNQQFKNPSSYINSAIAEASNIIKIQPNQVIANKYKIYTYFDPATSSSLSESIKHNTNAMTNSIVIDNKSGGILAFNSSYTYGATNIQRNPASTIKPILVYGAGIEYGKIYPCSLLDDNPTTYDGNYTPQNISNKYYGKISAELALAKSLNIPAINLFKEVGIEKCKSFAKKNGIEFDESDSGLSLALGAMKYGVTIQSLCDAYVSFANLGYHKDSTFIKKIEDSNGKVIYTHKPLSHKVMSEETAYLVGQMMKKTTTEGTCTALGNLGYEVHAKSGTNGTKDSNYNTDSICVAQTTSHTACIWYFSKDNKDENLLKNVSTSQLSPTLKMKSLFQSIYTSKSMHPTNFEKPKGIVTKKLDTISYDNGNIELATADTPERYTMDCEFNIKYVPKTISKNFTNIILTYLQSKISTINSNEGEKSHSLTLSFPTLRHQKYELIKEYEENGKTHSKTILVVSGKSDNIEFIDSEFTEQTNIKYYVKIYNTVLNDYELSNVVDFKTKDNSGNLDIQSFKAETESSYTLARNNKITKQKNYNYYNYFR